MDDVDFANERVTEMEQDKINQIRRSAAAIPKGEPGDCDGCGEYFTRTVGGYCARCRDKRVHQR
jgi:hypothetical protein